MKTKLSVAGFIAALFSVIMIPAPAQAATFTFECADQVDYSYHCASIYGIAVWEYFGSAAGHVAWVQDVITNSLGNTTAVVIIDDQYGNRRTTITTYYKKDTATNLPSDLWPDHFISFPQKPSAGGKGYDMLSLGQVNP